MFGWRQVGFGVTHERKRYGVTLEFFQTGLWLTIYVGARSWAFTRYTRNRHTGSGENRAVLGFFHRGPERRRKSRDFRSGFAEAAAKPSAQDQARQ